MTTFLQVPATVSFTLPINPALHTKQQQSQQKTKSAAARTHAPPDLLAFVLHASTGNADVRPRTQPFSERHSCPPRAPVCFGDVCVMNTSVKCKGTAHEVGNAIASGLETSPFLCSRGGSCSIKCNADTYTIFVRVVIDACPVSATLRMYTNPDGSILVEACRERGDRLAYSNLWQETQHVLRAHGVVVEEERERAREEERGMIVDMCALEDEMWEEMETDVPSDVSSDDGGDTDSETQETRRHMSHLHPVFVLAGSSDMSELTEATQICARMSRTHEGRSLFASPMYVSALNTILTRARASAQKIEGGVSGLLDVVCPAVCAIRNIAAENPHVCVDANTPHTLVGLLNCLLTPTTPAVSPLNGFEMVARDIVRCLLDMCVSSHVSSIYAGGLRETLGGLRDAVSALGDLETQQLFDRLVGELGRK